MKKIILIIFAIMLTGTVNSQWVQQTSGTTTHLYDAWMFSNDNILTCGDNGTILRTTNAGTNWNPVASGSTASLGSIYFVNSVTGWIYTFNNGLLKSVNGGNTWNSVGNLSGNGKVMFINVLSGWAASNGSLIYKTINGGTNWTLINLPLSCSAKDVHFLNLNTGYAFGVKPPADSSYIFKSIDGGLTWNLFHGASGKYINMHVLDESNVFFCGFNGAFSKTNDNGVSWQGQPLPVNDNLNDIKFINSTTGFTCGSGGKIFTTSDGGVNWNQQASPLTNSLQSVKFMPGDGETGYIFGLNGTILKTTNGGLSGINQISTELPGKYSLSQNYPNPFNPTTNINFSIPASGNVKMVVFDMTGKQVGELVNSRLSAGTYKVDFDGSHLSSGVYFYRLVTESFSEVRKMILVK